MLYSNMKETAWGWLLIGEMKPVKWMLLYSEQPEGNRISCRISILILHDPVSCFLRASEAMGTDRNCRDRPWKLSTSDQGSCPILGQVWSYDTGHEHYFFFILFNSTHFAIAYNFDTIMLLHSDVGFHCPRVHWGNTSHLRWAWSAGFWLTMW